MELWNYCLPGLAHHEVTPTRLRVQEMRRGEGGRGGGAGAWNLGVAWHEKLERFQEHVEQMRLLPRRFVKSILTGRTEAREQALRKAKALQESSLNELEDSSSMSESGWLEGDLHALSVQCPSERLRRGRRLPEQDSDLTAMQEPGGSAEEPDGGGNRTRSEYRFNSHL